MLSWFQMFQKQFLNINWSTRLKSDYEIYIFSEFLAMRSGVEVTEVPGQHNLQTESQQLTDQTEIVHQ